MENTAVSRALPAPEPAPAAAEAFFGERFALAQAYHRSLTEVASERGFIGPKEVERLWSRHLLNCAVVSDALPEGVRVADVGSGAGLPGIPLAIARPDLPVTLIEPLLKRSTYLSDVTQQLGLDNVTVVRGRAEEYTGSLFDVVTSRAVAPLGKLAGWCLPLVTVGGVMLAMKGASVGEELERDARDIVRAGGGDAEILTAGEGVLEQPTTLIRIPRRR
ncbi:MULTISPECIES: 16S rRNA (guanine(527)-N(7))-methyltransferase RsmG [Corynebacterium]|uniref:Ribosomal RNA small subunit methyltransferase G n=1 Tax=Corynebacterium timonense TaxID=441500 RepID=A0A1H1UEC3_9CORY|nr:MULTISPECIES: 16S rRNA (guanine(527)-N(7))-methyltransferase RsmG [Corynebacterium]WJY69149.1 Ribosomal RNA small subunit methyltransferase G [Corynebacterium auris]SDS70825.1 16S rRNA m(7)G-527 methyltransferase [Corynebacterium timonense]